MTIPSKGNHIHLLPPSHNLSECLIAVVLLLFALAISEGQLSQTCFKVISAQLVRVNRAKGGVREGADGGGEGGAACYAFPTWTEERAPDLV